MALRINTIHGRHLLCGGMLPVNSVKAGQIWAAADGSDRTVMIESGGEWVDYSWVENGRPRIHTMMNFTFQCRYCLVLDKAKVPEELV